MVDQDHESPESELMSVRLGGRGADFESITSGYHMEGMGK